MKHTILSLVLITAFSNAFGEEIQEVDIGESVVTASGYEQLVKDAPASISVVSKEELETKPYRDLGEAVADIPGVDIQRGKTGGFTIFIRGFESKYTLFLIDGKRQNPSDGFNKNGFDAVNTSFMPPISMIERIEVIRGPASTLYGSDAIGGVINVITKKNPDKLAGSITLESTFAEDRITWGNSYGISGYLAVPLIKDMLSLSTRGKVYSKESSFLQYPNGNAQGNTAGLYDLYNLGARLNYTINSNHNVYLDGEYYLQRVSAASLYGQTITNTDSVQSDYTRINSTLNHDGSYDFGRWNTYLQYNSTEQKGTEILYSDNYILKTQLVSPLDLGALGFMKLNGGGEIWYEEFRYAQSVNQNALNAGIDNDMRHKALSQTQISLFLEDEYIINDYIALTAGARYTYGSIFESAITPRAYFVFKPFTSKSFDFLTIKGGVATGYKVPAIQELSKGIYHVNSQGANPRYGNPNLKPESSINYEIGADLDFEYINFAITGFYTDFSNKIEYEDVANNAPLGHGYTGNCITITGRGNQRCSFRINLDSARSLGVESTFKLKPIFGIGFDLAYTFVDSKQLTGASAGRPIQNQPRHLIVARLGYNYKDFSTYIKSTSRLQTPTSPGSVRNAIGEYYKDSNLLDLNFNYKFDETLMLNFSVNNLLNQKLEYIASGTSYVNAYQNWFDGRSYWVSLRKDF